MNFSPRTRYLLVSAAVIVASLAKLAMGTRPLIVGVALITFLIAGNGAVWLSGSKARAMRRQQKRDYYAG